MAAQALIGLAIAWLATGLILGYVMKRRGHDFYVWLLLGSVLGPLSIPLAFENVRSEAEIVTTEAALHPKTKGGLDVLVALDGSDESAEALRTALPVMGMAPTSLTFVTVLDYEAFDAPADSEVRLNAEAMLDKAANSVTDREVTTAVLFGKPSRVLLDYAVETGKDVIVIGARGHGASELIFGSVARAIVSESPVPVLVGPRPRETSA